MALRIVGLSALVGVLFLGFIALASFASAAVAPTVTVTVHDEDENDVSSALVGSPLHAHVEVASSSATTTPLGTVDFHLFSGNETCSGTSTVEANVPLEDGFAGSSTTTLPIGGLSYRVHYDGQEDIYTEADSECVAVSADMFTPSLALSLSDDNVEVGSFVHATPSLIGESSNASGTIEYRVYENDTCTNLVLDAGDKEVADGSTPNSDAFPFNATGTFHWQGHYTGDTNNAAATSSCAGAVLTVVATTTDDDDDGKDDDKDDDDKDDNDKPKKDKGKHKGFLNGLPFGIFKKVFGDEDFPIPPGIVKRFLGEDYFSRIFDWHEKDDDKDERYEEDDDDDDEKEWSGRKARGARISR